jgi:hypothetical protein
MFYSIKKTAFVTIINIDGIMSWGLSTYDVHFHCSTIEQTQAVAILLQALSYKLEDRGFETR